MAGMALLLVFAVTQDDGGWTASSRNDPRVNRTEAVDVPDALPSALRDSSSSDSTLPSWTEFEDALNRPIDRSAPSSDRYTGLRRARGADRPPQPPLSDPPPERGRVREWLDDPLERRQGDAPYLSELNNEPARRANPRDRAHQPRRRQPDTDDRLIEVPDLDPDLDPNRQRDRDLLYEQRLAENDRRYLVPPPREQGDSVKPVPFTDRDEPSDDNGTPIDLPSVDLPMSSPNNFADERRGEETSAVAVRSPSDEQESSVSSPESKSPGQGSDQEGPPEPQRSRWPLIWAMIGLFGSVAFNFYFGWIAWDIHGRYQDVVDEVRELENQLDQHQPRSDTADSRRVRAYSQAE